MDAHDGTFLWFLGLWRTVGAGFALFVGATEPSRPTVADLPDRFVRMVPRARPPARRSAAPVAARATVPDRRPIGCIGAPASTGEAGLVAHLSDQVAAPTPSPIVTPRVRVRAEHGTTAGEPRVFESTVRRYAGQLRPCYERQVRANADLEGSLEIAWRVADGTVGGLPVVVTDTTGDAALGRCAVGEIRRWVFPANAEGTVIWTFGFRREAARQERPARSRPPGYGRIVPPYAIDPAISELAVVVPEAGVVLVQTWTAPFAACRTPPSAGVAAYAIADGEARWRCGDCSAPVHVAGTEVVYAWTWDGGVRLRFADARTGATTAECGADWPRGRMPEAAGTYFTLGPDRFRLRTVAAPCPSGVEIVPPEYPQRVEVAVERSDNRCVLRPRLEEGFALSQAIHDQDHRQVVGDLVVRVRTEGTDATREHLEVLGPDGVVRWSKPVRETESIPCCPP